MNANTVREIRCAVRGGICLLFLAWAGAGLPAYGQGVSATIQGRVYDKTGAAISEATVAVVNAATGLTRTVTASATGDYQIPLLPVGDYTVTADKSGFQKQVKKVHIDIGGSANLDFNLAVGQVAQEVNVQDIGEVAEPTRTMISSVIDEQKIDQLPVNGRQFIDFALLAPGVTVGDTTSGSTDVIIEPVTKLSFAGQNIHYNFVAIDGADNMSTASGIQKTTPSQDAVQEFRVINSDYSTEFGRAVGGIVNIITKSGTNTFHGSVYEYFRNDVLDAKSPLAGQGFNKLRQNQFGATIGGPIQKDKTFYFANYEGQRHVESPFYNSAVLNNIAAINNVKTTVFGLPAENLHVNRDINYDNFTGKLDHTFSEKETAFVRYFLNDQRSTNLSPLNDGFDLPSGFKNNTFRDQSIVANLVSVVSPSLVNEARFQYAHRFFDFPTTSTQPHLEVSNVFTVGVNRGNPDFYEEGRYEFVDDVTKTWGNHTINFGGDFNHVNTTESFPLFYPFEADFASIGAFLGTDGAVTGCGFAQCPDPFVIFFERFNAASNFTEPSIATSVYQGGAISSAVRNQAKGELGHTYEGLYIQDKWRVTQNFTLNYGLRWEGETWPSAALNNVNKNFDPRVGFSWAPGGHSGLVIRGGAGIFHGTIPSPLLMCQIPSCGGTIGPFPGRENKEDSLNAKTRLFAFASSPALNNFALSSLLLNGLYPDATPAGFCPNGFLSTCGFFGDSVIARFAKDHKPPYGVQASFGIEVQPFKDAVLDITGLHVRGVHLGSFYNVNQPPQNGCPATLHSSQGGVGQKLDYHVVAIPGDCTPGTSLLPFPGTAQPNIAVYFEADSKWDSQWDGLLVNFNKRTSHHIGMGISYTWSKGIDNGPNPSFVLIPQDSCCFNKERAVSSDSVSNRFVANATLYGPEHKNAFVNGWQLGTIVTLESPHYFTKFAGSDVNGDIFGNNDRVGIEPRNTFQGDGYQSVDMRLSRTFAITEKVHMEALAEGFNLLNTLNVHFFNTAYGAADFCPFVSGAAQLAAVGCPLTPSGNREGSPNAAYGTPRSIFNPRQIQLAVKFTW